MRQVFAETKRLIPRPVRQSAIAGDNPSLRAAQSEQAIALRASAAIATRSTPVHQVPAWSMRVHAVEMGAARSGQMSMARG